MNNGRNVKPGGFALHLTQFLASDRYNVSREIEKRNNEQRKMFLRQRGFFFAQQKNKNKKKK